MMADFGNLFARWCMAALITALLGACSGWEPIDYHETSNIPEGPGLVSGDKGGWTIFRIEEKKKPKAKQSAESDGEKADQREVE